MKTLTATEIMSKNVIWVKTGQTLEDLAMLFCEHSITGAPVMDDMGQIAGVVSRSDIVNYMNATSLRENTKSGDDITVKDIMTPTVFSVSEQSTLLNIIDLMMEHKVHRLFVMRGKEIVGIITTGDLLRVTAESLRA